MVHIESSAFTLSYNSPSIITYFLTLSKILNFFVCIVIYRSFPLIGLSKSISTVTSLTL